MPLGICRLIRVSFDTKLSAILIFRGIHFGHTAKVNFAEAIVYEKTIVSAVSVTSAEFTWPKFFDSSVSFMKLHNNTMLVYINKIICILPFLDSEVQDTDYVYDLYYASESQLSSNHEL